MASQHDPGVDTHPPKLNWKERSVILWPLLRVASGFLRAPLRHDPSGAPVPDLVLRVGVAGHIVLPQEAEIRPRVTQILRSLQQEIHAALPEYRSAFAKNANVPAVRCRLISQLAAGADQLAAECAVELGFELECPIPATREEFAADIARNPGLGAGAVETFHRLAAQASVFELEELGQTETIPGEVYESSAWTMLLHTDVLLALVRSGAERQPAGTHWLIEEAGRRGVPVIQLLVDQPESSSLLEGDEECRKATPLTDSEWSTRLVRSVVLPPKKDCTPYASSGRLIERFRASVPANREEWPPYWIDGDATPGLKASKDWASQATDNLFRFWYWAEHRANVYRDLYQAAYISIALLGLVAVGGALMGVHAAFLPYKTEGKYAEIVAIGLMLIIWLAARKASLRQRWLNYRWLEQQIRNAAVLEVVGRTVSTLSSPLLAETQKEGAWIAWYLRSVLRQAQLPKGKLDRAALQRAGEVILRGQIERQIAYYAKQRVRAHKANHRLESVVWAALGLTLGTAVGYVAGLKFLELPALVMGLFGPALAASLAAVRAQGEYAQLEIRYKGLQAHLQSIANQLKQLLTSAPPDHLTGRRLARYSVQASSAMLDEVSHWRSLLHTNEPDV